MATTNTSWLLRATHAQSMLRQHACMCMQQHQLLGKVKILLIWGSTMKVHVHNSFWFISPNLFLMNSMKFCPSSSP